MRRDLWKRNALIALGICIFAPACQNTAELREGRTSVEFAFAVTSGKATFPHLKSLEDASALVVSIEDTAGTIVYDSERVELYDFNGDHLSQPLSLRPGTYMLTEFLVVDAADDVLYATPFEGSEIAYLVADPLEIAFDISEDTVTTIRPEVLSTAEHAPEDFGYASFGPDIVPVLDFLVAAFIYDDAAQTLAMTSAGIDVTSGAGDELYSGVLDARTNKISVQDGHAQYQVTITKPGYETHAQTFTGAELAAYFDSTDRGPLEVVLEEASDLTSCEAILDAGLSTGSGMYTIDPDGAGSGVAPFEVYCDMTTLGGGWTLFAYHTDTNDVIEANPVQPGVEGALTDQRWLALRDGMQEGMMFIDDSDRVSMISLDKLNSGNCISIGQTDSLVANTNPYGRLWHNEDSGCEGSGTDYSEFLLTNNSSYGAALYQYSSVKFDVWPYSANVSNSYTDTLAYFLK